jgi:hypothetical protein
VRGERVSAEGADLCGGGVIAKNFVGGVMII